MNPLSISLTLLGQRITGVRIPIGSSVVWTLSLLDPVSQTPIDLTSGSPLVVMSLAQVGINGQPSLPAALERAAALPSSAPTNVCTVAWTPLDTAPVGAALPAGAYTADVWLEQSSTRLQMASISLWLMPSVRLPGDVTQ